MQKVGVPRVFSLFFFLIALLSPVYYVFGNLMISEISLNVFAEFLQGLS